MTARLAARSVRRHVESAAEHLSPLQRSRVEDLAKLIGADGRISMAAALDVAAPGGDDTKRQDAFRKFRGSLDAAMGDAGVELTLQVDSLKTAPSRRHCWFAGADTVAAEVAELSALGAGDLDPATAVEPAARDVGPVRRRVLVSASPVGPRKDYDEFVRRLRRRLTVDRFATYEVLTSYDLPVGVGRDEEVTRRIDSADYVVCLVDVDYLQPEDPALDAARPPSRAVLIDVAFDSIPAGADCRGLEPSTFVPQGPAYRARAVRQRDDVIDDVIATLTRAAASPAVTTLPAAMRDQPYDLVARLSFDSAGRELPPAPTDARAAETSFDQHLGEGRPLRPVGEPVAAVQRLLDWAADSSDASPQHCALLGDTGMGKTTTAKLFTQRLLRLRRNDSTHPLPIYLDLRDLPISRPGQPRDARAFQPGSSLNEILGLLLNALDVPGRRPSAQELRDLVDAGGCILIFDGLDEVLVHLAPNDAQRFAHTLWHAVSKAPALVDGPGPAPSKVLLSCRTHYFRTMREEATYFTGQDREGPRRTDYLALLMLPFDDAQIRTYLSENIPGCDVEALMQVLGSVHDLRELAERPYTLKLLATQLAYIEQAKLDGRRVRGVDLYGEFVSRWLERDAGKHNLLPDHKAQLMEQLAADQWRSGQAGWRASDVDQWLVEFIDRHPEVAVHYRHPDPELWKEDLRTATFVVRRDDDLFAFAHTSMREYFLARHLLRALLLGGPAAGKTRARWSLPVPSRETLDFLGQSIDGLAEDDQQVALAALRSLRSTAHAGASELVFAYGLHALAAGHPAHSLVGSCLDGAQLHGIEVGSAGVSVDMRSASLRGAAIRASRWRNVDLRGAVLDGADLNLAELTGCDLREVRVDGTSLVGTIFRHSQLPGAGLRSADAYRTQVLHCAGADVENVPGWLVALLSPAGQAALDTRAWRLSTLPGHTRGVTVGGYSPDGTRIFTGDDGGDVRVFDAATGEQLPHRIELLPGGEAASWLGGTLTHATPGAWRWLGWVGVLDGELTRLPAETFGPLPGAG